MPTVRASRRAASVIALAVAITGQGAAAAASIAVQLACTGDYYAFCSRFDPINDRNGLNACMKANGAKLSQRCVDALVAEGEVTKADVAGRAKK